MSAPTRVREFFNKIYNDADCVDLWQVHAYDESRKRTGMTQFAVCFKTEEIFKSFERESFPRQWGEYVKYYQFDDSKKCLHLFVPKKIVEVEQKGVNSTNEATFSNILAQTFPKARFNQSNSLVASFKVESNYLKRY